MYHQALIASRPRFIQSHLNVAEFMMAVINTFSNHKMFIRQSIALNMTWKSHFNHQASDLSERYEMEKVSTCLWTTDKEQSVQYLKKTSLWQHIMNMMTIWVAIWHKCISWLVNPRHLSQLMSTLHPAIWYKSISKPLSQN